MPSIGLHGGKFAPRLRGGAVEQGAQGEAGGALDHVGAGLQGPDRGVELAGVAADPQVAVLGVLFVAIAMTIDGAWALSAGWLGERLGRSDRLRRTLDRASGVVLIGLGALAAHARR